MKNERKFKLTKTKRSMKEKAKKDYICLAQFMITDLIRLT